MEKKKKGNWFLKTLLVLFIMFLCLYSISMNGYIENINKKKTLYTEEQIKKFETDVSNGEYLDLKDYTLVKDIDYSNKMSDFGEDLSEIIAVTASKSIDFLNNILSYLFY
ncbi:MAG: hypothetical protein J1F35_07400 [Erysipelotrichales bacterium]|nr:hypothetical protein [Erysipelotrichales bacterium]